jgi:hypothetical protein
VAFTLGPKEEDGVHTRQLNLTFEAGLWTVSLAFEDLGYAEKVFMIEPGQTTEVVIHRNDFVSPHRKVTVAGSLTRTFGEPVRGAKLELQDSRWFFQSEEEREPPKEGITDSEGKFQIRDLRPGSWYVTVSMPEGCILHYPYQLIPHDAVNPYPLDLVVPEGRVKGTLRDGRIKEPLDPEGTVWRATVRNVKTRMKVSGLSRKKRSGILQITGVPEGTYELNLYIDGYWDYKSRPFSVSGGETVDLGPIDLEPCGALLLEVLDEKGEVVDDYRLFCNEREIPHYLGYKQPAGGTYYSNLPVDDVNLSILAEDFKEQEVTLELKPAQTVVVRVMLER